MKRKQTSSGDSSKKKAKETLPDMSGFTSIGRRVSEGVFDGKPVVVKRNVSDEYLSLYDLWKSTKALPEVYATWKDKETGSNTVMMEKLVPFVYKKELEPAYYASVEEVYSLSKFDNMDISPKNTMMRTDGQIVFIEAWTTGYTSVYFCSRKKDLLGKGNDPLTGIRKSLGRVLFFYEHREKIQAMHETKMQELKSILPTKERFRFLTSLDDRIYNPIQNKCLYTLAKIEWGLVRARMAKNYVEKLGKKIEDYDMLSSTQSTIPELDEYLDTVVFETFANLPDLAKEIGATEEQLKNFE